MRNKIFLGITKKLSDQLKIKKLNNIDIYSPTVRMWHAGFKYINRKKCILFTNDLTLYSFFLYGVKKKELENLEQIFLEELIENLEYEEFKKDEIDKIIKEKDNIEFIKTNNRSVIGSMNDYFRLIPYYIEERIDKFIEYDGQINLIKLNSQLNRTPMQCSKKGFFPIDKLREVVEYKEN
ncbi:MAG: hypothetical protein JEZ04_18615 [Spirochaetales bacterium]|nr:hypothetical protein [Spirochaetales bacterium]